MSNKKNASKKATRPATPPLPGNEPVSSTKVTMDELKDKIRELTYQNKEIQETQRLQEQDSLEIIKSIQNESDIKDRKVIVLEKQLDRLRNDMDKERIQTVKSNEERFAGLIHI